MVVVFVILIDLLKHQKKQSVYRRVYQKLASCYLGSYKVLYRIGKISYELQFLENCLIHPIFHVSLLQWRMGSAEVVSMSLPKLSEQGEPNMVPEWVLSQRSILIHGVPQCHVLIKWKYLL